MSRKRKMCPKCNGTGRVFANPVSDIVMGVLSLGITLLENDGLEEKWCNYCLGLGYYYD